jgi:hypothetical protein
MNPQQVLVFCMFGAPVHGPTCPAVYVGLNYTTVACIYTAAFKESDLHM